jgi:hypothetical protein
LYLLAINNKVNAFRNNKKPANAGLYSQIIAWRTLARNEVLNSVNTTTHKPYDETSTSKDRHQAVH